MPGGAPSRRRSSAQHRVLTSGRRSGQAARGGGQSGSGDGPPRETLRGRFVLLRPGDPAVDAESLYDVSHPPHGDEGIWRYLSTGPYDSREALRERLRAVAESTDPLFFTLVRLPEGRPEGQASYLRMAPEHGVIKIGHVWFGTPLQRTPAATEAIYLLPPYV